MVSLTNNAHHHAAKSPLGNANNNADHHDYDYDYAAASRTKYKRRLVSAVRTFPPGCGPQPMPINYPPRRLVSAVRRFPPFCGRNAPPPLVNKTDGTHMQALEISDVDDDATTLKDNDFVSTKKVDENATGKCFDTENLEENQGQDNMANIDGLVERLVNIYSPKEDFDEFKFAEHALAVPAPKISKTQQKTGFKLDSEKKKTDIKMVKPLNYVRNQTGAAVGQRKHKPAHSALKKNTSTKEKQGQIVLWDGETSTDEYESKKSRTLCVTVNPPPRVGSSSVGARRKVKDTLRLFQCICRKILQEDEAKQFRRLRIDLDAAKVLKEKNKLVNTDKQYIGPVPGVEVGDEFNYRVELAIVGVHRLYQGGIDYVRQGGKILATSIVASGGYNDDLDSSDVLIYSGQGGTGDKKKGPEDQKLERGNLSLANSKDERNPVRVIRGETANPSDPKSKIYIYDGLYVVDSYWQDMGQHGKMVYQFRLVRIPGQPELAWKVVKKSKNLNSREGVCLKDISQGREKFPICVVNTIDDEKPPSFQYTKTMIYPDWCQPIPPKACDCKTKCSESGKCRCVMKNGGEIPYNHNGAIVVIKSLVYECGPTCKCPSSCYNRVSQKGIRFQLEIFKTESRGWGVRSINSIPAGSFICEYVGELLDDKEAEKRTGNDEYLFDIGNKYDDGALNSEVSTVMPVAQSKSSGVVSSGFTIDAAKIGNVGRFINHSCSPNLYAQNVLYDHEDYRIPHIMLFAADNVPPLQELTYHYNYGIDQVRDSNGNIKIKNCYCGSSECSGRMY
ncbi:hypothetical protein ACFE04_023066 [Oxalis oulophora]